MPEPTFPLTTTWSLYALGSTRGRRAGAPKDALARWLLEHDPALAPGITPGSVLAMLRVRHDLVEALLAGVVGPRRHVLTLGCGFDTRWRRWQDRVGRWTMVDVAPVVGRMERLIAASEHASTWRSVERVSARPEAWAGDLAPGAVVVAEGLATRCGPAAFRAVLARLSTAEDVRVIFDLPGFLADPPIAPSGGVQTLWRAPLRTGAGSLTTSELRAAGWTIEADIQHAGRPDVRGPGGVVFAPGVEAVRVLQLRSAG
ncbi:MAG: O-methyltransferase involved in polyketide biosynthesis [Myxococcota bacterium]